MLGIEDLYLLNLVLTGAMFAVLVWRAYMETKSIKASLEDHDARKKLGVICKILRAESKEISKMNKKELGEFMEHLLELLIE